MTELQIHHSIVLGWIALSVVLLPVLLFITAPYGRHTKGGWGPTISNKLGWIVMEAPAVLVFALFFLVGDLSQSITALVFLLMWETHYINRAFVFPLRIKSQGKRMPVMIMGSAIFFNVVNGYINGRYLFTLSGGYDASWLADPRFLLGAAMFACGLAINIHSDNVLLSLRKPGETGYTVPRGGLYRFVTCPNYFGEIVEWTGWAIATWSLPGLAFALWTAANLVPRALSHHRWYRERFADYPSERRAVVPFLL